MVCPRAVLTHPTVSHSLTHPLLSPSLDFSLAALRHLSPLRALHNAWNQCELLSKQWCGFVHGILKTRGRQRGREEGESLSYLQCSAVLENLLSADLRASAHQLPHIPGIVCMCWKLTEESHLVTIASPNKHNPCWGPSAGVFQAPCRWCHWNQPQSTLLSGESWWADSLVGVLHRMVCFSLLILQGDESLEPPTERLCPLPEGACQLWPVMSCSRYRLTHKIEKKKKHILCLHFPDFLHLLFSFLLCFKL